MVENMTQFGNSDDRPKVVRSHKDTTFRLLFNQKKEAAELYQALTGIQCREEDVEIVTLEQSLVLDFVNDLAFIVGNKTLVISEHQSTPSMNMPLRMALYFGRLYERILDARKEIQSLYGTRLLKIPTPEFVVLYNGEKEWRGGTVLELSSAFDNPVSAGMGSISLQIPVYDINKGQNCELLSKSKTLAEYAELIATIRERYTITKDWEKAAQEGVDICKRKRVLGDFLVKHGGGIVDILKEEFTVEDRINLSREEGIEEGIKEGIKEGSKNTAKKFVINLYRSGFTDKMQIQQLTEIDDNELEQILSELESE